MLELTMVCPCIQFVMDKCKIPIKVSHDYAKLFTTIMFGMAQLIYV